jgi:hypothetical protein
MVCGNALTKGSGRCFHARSQAVIGSVFRMARALTVKLAEVHQLVEPEVEAVYVEHTVEQHRSVAARQNEAIAIDPIRIGWIKTEETIPKNLHDGS